MFEPGELVSFFTGARDAVYFTNPNLCIVVKVQDVKRYVVYDLVRQKLTECPHWMIVKGLPDKDGYLTW